MQQLKELKLQKDKFQVIMASLLPEIKDNNEYNQFFKSQLIRKQVHKFTLHILKEEHIPETCISSYVTNIDSCLKFWQAAQHQHLLSEHMMFSLE